MDKRVCLIFVFLLVSFMLINLVSAGIESSVEDITKKIENTANNVDNFVSREDIRSQYLKKEWDKVLTNNSGFFGKIYRGYNKVSPYSDPVFEYVVGIVPSLSWMFLLVLVVWFMLVKYYYTFYEVLRDFSTFSDLTSIVVSFGFFVILIVLQFFQVVSVWGANKIIELISFVNSPIMQVMLVIVGIIVLILMARFSREIKILAKFIKMKRYKINKETEEKERDERQKEATEKVEKVAEAINGSIAGNAINGWDVKLSNGQGGWFRNKSDADKYLRDQ